MALDKNVVINIAKGEVGYLEKASNANLDSKKGNAGYNNYTKYWRDIANWGCGNWQAQYWCAGFVFWCFVKSYGLKKAQEMFYANVFINCQIQYNIHSSKGLAKTNPSVGDVVVFRSGNQFGHTGLVISCNSSSVTTIEGNTSADSGVIANGGGVSQKTYSMTYIRNNGARFLTMNYGGNSSSIPTPTVPDVTDTSSYMVKVKANGGLNIRQSATTSSSIIGSLTDGTTVTIVCTRKNWGQLKQGGWICLDYTTSVTKPPITNKDSYVVTVKVSDFLNVRSKPNTSSSILTTLKNGTKVTIVQTSGNWGKRKQGGWICLDYTVKGNTSGNVITSYKVTVATPSGLNIRQSATTSSPIIGGLTNGTTVTIVQTSGNWGKIDGSGWICLDYTVKNGSSPSVKPDTSYKVKVTANSGLNVRSKPNTSSSIITALVKGTTVTIVETSGNWGKRSNDGWICLDYTTRV